MTYPLSSTGYFHFDLVRVVFRIRGGTRDRCEQREAQRRLELVSGDGFKVSSLSVQMPPGRFLRDSRQESEGLLGGGGWKGGLEIFL